MGTKLDAWGLLCDPAIRWLIMGEPEVSKAVQEFILDRCDGNVLPVAGPPTVADIMSFRADPNGKLQLPLVHLTMSKVKVGIVDRADAVRVVCSEPDLEMIKAWRNTARFKAHEAESNVKIVEPT